MILLNLGSGSRKFEGWLNIDCQDKDQPDLVADISDLPLPDDYADVVLLNHVLEHFELSRGGQLLRECWRVLKPGGRLVITVPDLRTLASRWLSGEISNYVFCINVYGPYAGSEADFHRWGFDYSELVERLGEGWKIIRPLANYKLPLGAEIPAAWWILGVEAFK